MNHIKHGFVVMALTGAFLLMLAGLSYLVMSPLPAAPAEYKPAPSWYVEVLRGGEHESAYVCKAPPRLADLAAAGMWEFNTVEGEHILTTAPMIIKERPPFVPPPATPKFTPCPASKF